MRIFLGEAPNRSSYDPAFVGDSWGRVENLFGPLFSHCFHHRLNVCQRKQPRVGNKGSQFSASTMILAIESTIATVLEMGGPNVRIVIAGKRLAHSIGLAKDTQYFEASHLPEKFDNFGNGDPLCWIVPHPSGINRWWNDPSNCYWAREWADKFAQELVP